MRLGSACIDTAIQWSDDVSIKPPRSVPGHGRPMLEKNLNYQLSHLDTAYPFSCASSNRWVAFSSLAYGAQHDFNQGCLLSVCKSCMNEKKKKERNETIGSNCAPFAYTPYKYVWMEPVTCLPLLAMCHPEVSWSYSPSPSVALYRIPRESPPSMPHARGANISDINRHSHTNKTWVTNYFKRCQY